MEKTKFLAQAVHEDEICDGQLNMIKAPVGSGKTTWALRHLSKNMESPLGSFFCWHDDFLHKDDLIPY